MMMMMNNEDHQWPPMTINEDHQWPPMTTNAMRTTNDQDLNCNPLGWGAEDCDATPVRGLSYLMIINIVINYDFNIIWIELVGILKRSATCPRDPTWPQCEGEVGSRRRERESSRWLTRSPGGQVDCCLGWPSSWSWWTWTMEMVVKVMNYLPVPHHPACCRVVQQCVFLTPATWW